MVIYAGLQNIPGLGQTPEANVQALISGWQGKALHNCILVYALAENHREEHLTTQCSRWNSSMHQVCKELGLQA